MRNEFHGWCKSHRRFKTIKLILKKIREIRSARRQKKGPWDESVNESGDWRVVMRWKSINEANVVLWGEERCLSFSEKN
jgi:hypothetical protein